MLQLTVKDVIEGDWDKLDPTEEPHCIYVIRDGSAVLYVGKSNDPFNRLLAHFGKSWHGSGAAIGSFYDQHQEHAHDWTIELYTLEDCNGLTKGKYEDSAYAERAMIAHFKPCLNVLNNPHASALPDKYLAAESKFLEDNAVDYINF